MKKPEGRDNRLIKMKYMLKSTRVTEDGEPDIQVMPYNLKTTRDMAFQQKKASGMYQNVQRWDKRVTI